MDQVPRDVLADVLALLPPRALAVSRCVCRDWRDVVDTDARCQLRTDLLPLSVAGIFVTTYEAEPPEFFVRPSMARKIAGDLPSYLKMDKEEHGDSLASIVDCCNGLILLDDHVVNPATKQWMRLPPYPTLPEEKQSLRRRCYYYPYLVFDPSLSPYFEVFSVKYPLDYKDELSEESQWPPLEYMVRVYSSNTQRWEEKPFLHEEEHSTIVANIRSKLDCGPCHAVYRHGALYVYWSLTFIMRITVSNNKYRVINLPWDVINDSTRYHEFRLGKSVDGVHFAVAGEELQVWFLDESCSKTEWVLKHVTRYQFNHDQIQTDRPWTLQHGRYYAYDDDDDNDNNDQEENNKEPTAVENNSDWDSDSDNAANIDLERVKKYDCPYFQVLGFHPYRDIVFLVFSKKVVAYYFNSSKIQHLGELFTTYRYDEIREGFIYTPTWIGDLPGANYLVRKRNSYSTEEEKDSYSTEEEDEDLLHTIQD